MNSNQCVMALHTSVDKLRSTYLLFYTVSVYDYALSTKYNYCFFTKDY